MQHCDACRDQEGQEMRMLWCRIFHRRFHYGPVEGWASSLWSECQVCGYTVACGRRKW